MFRQASCLPRATFVAALLLCAATGAIAQPAPASDALPSNPMPLAILQGLDKITARIYTLEVAIGQTVGFGTLKVTPRVCRKRPPEYPPESAAYLDIVEERPGEAAVQRFSGWMFASSPALNPLEHPVYDVWVIDCRAPRPAAR
ncbi:DUF2155 domain-containing protein [Ferrovibrio sp. MS7]|uniref:DUF2155 domain-containing protein n=1 Tax=Ferrovibrio plantarum TaxID=3119164 RepID=UPI00313663DC